MLPLTQLGYYIVPASLIQKFNMFSGAVTATAFPMITELDGRGETDRLRRLYLKASELSLFFLLPLSIIAFLLAPQFLTLWLGAEFSRLGTWPLRLLLGSNLIYFSTNLPMNTAVSKGHPEIYTYMATAIVILLGIFWAILIPHYGIAGAALGSMLAQLVCAPAFIGYVHRRFLAIDWKTYLSEVFFRPVIAGSVLAILGLAIHANATTWPRLFAFGAVGSVLYLGAGYRLLEPEAKSLFWDWLRLKS
jgi:O-antigen/teichoic acid export membrane protein